jgi:hypothetical protein
MASYPTYGDKKMNIDPGMEGQEPVYREVAAANTKSKGNVEDRLDRLYSLVEDLRTNRMRLEAAMAPVLLPENDGGTPDGGVPASRMSTVATSLDDLGDVILREIHAISSMIDRCDL